MEQLGSFLFLILLIVTVYVAILILTDCLDYPSKLHHYILAIPDFVFINLPVVASVSSLFMFPLFSVFCGGVLLWTGLSILIEGFNTSMLPIGDVVLFTGGHFWAALIYNTIRSKFIPI